MSLTLGRLYPEDFWGWFQAFGRPVGGWCSDCGSDALGCLHSSGP